MAVPMTTVLDSTNNSELVATLEEAALNGLPALQTEFYDGWIVRMSEGYSRRANCVVPLYESTTRSRRSWFIVKRRTRGHRYLVFSRFFLPVNLRIWTRPWRSFSTLETPIHWFKPCGLRPVPPLVPLPYRYTNVQQMSGSKPGAVCPVAISTLRYCAVCSTRSPLLRPMLSPGLLANP